MHWPLLPRKALFLPGLFWATLGVAIVLSPQFELNAANTVYDDDFTGPTRPLSARETARDFSQWEASSAVVTGDGLLTVDASKSGNETFRIQMPPLENRELIRVRLRTRSSGAENDSHISFGFVPSLSADPIKQAALWTIDRSDSFALMYSAGPGNENSIVGDGWFGEFARDNTQETEHLIEYNIKTGQVTVAIENGGHQRTLVADAPVNWNGIAGQPIPLENLAFFAISFYQQQPTEKGADAAYIKSIHLEVSDH